MKIIHKLAHVLGWNKGLSDSFWKGNKLMMSFKCSGCGKRQGIHQVDQLIDSLLSPPGERGGQ